MKKQFLLTALFLGTVLMASAQLKPGDSAVEFELPNIDGSTVSLSDYAGEKGVILIFTCNPCPFAKAYEERIIKLHQGYGSKGYPVVAINPNDISISPDDTQEKMKERSDEKSFPFVYLKDTKEIFKAYGATRTPHVYLLKNEGKGKFKVAFIGAIDDNAMDAKAVSEKYVEMAIRAIELGNQPDPAEVKAIGCTIKTKS